MQDWMVWLILFAPAIFAFFVGGGFWYFCYSSTSSIHEAAEKFKIYTWLILPVASLGYLVWVFFRTPENDRQQLLDGAVVDPILFVLAAGLGLLMALVAVWAMKWLYRLAAEKETEESTDEVAENASAFITSEFRELPGLVVIAPVAEEFVFRGYGAMAFHDIAWPLAALITSTAFALIHFKPLQVLFAFFVGLAFYTLFHFTGNLLAPIVAHSATNLFIWIWLRYEAPRR